MITIIDYGAGNIRSIANSVAALGYQAKVTSSPDDVAAADVLILPGVGAAADTMKSLKNLGITDALTDYIAGDRPFLGICIGLQVLFDRTEENGGNDCLGIVHGEVRRLRAVNKIPHMGWNQVRQCSNHPVFQGIPDSSYFYFVHSYYPVPEDKSIIAGETDYGVSFCSVIARGGLVATQFHPEKSGDAGLRFLGNFVEFGTEKAKSASVR
ncbi:MAG: imidazole glycerol phosphate synthase subunit HisH [Dehalococcoidia bacterium]|jgi:glutamine amidotransferase